MYTRQKINKPSRLLECNGGDGADAVSEAESCRTWGLGGGKETPVSSQLDVEEPLSSSSVTVGGPSPLPLITKH